MSTVTGKLNFVSFDWLRWLMILFAIAGLAVSAYLMWGYTVPGVSLACGGSSGCESVKNSPYSSVLGIPLPVVGLLSYLTLLILVVVQGQSFAGGTTWLPYMALVIFGISLIGVLYSAYLTYLEFFVIYAICRWCITSAVIMAVMFILSLFNLYQSNQTYNTKR